MVYVGEIVNTHGIKGELRIVSDFKYKDSVFVKGKKLYLGKENKKSLLKLIVLIKTMIWLVLKMLMI